MVVFIINPLISNIRLQILLSCGYTLLIAERGESFNLSKEFTLGDYILYSHDFSDRESVDITERNLTLITNVA